MQLRIPFFYKGNVDVLNGEKGVSRIVLDVMDIDIREVSHVDAPVALAFEDRSFDWARRQFRVHEGEFYGGFMTKAGRHSTRRIAGMKRTPCGSSPPRDLIGFLAGNGGYPFGIEWQHGAKTIERWWQADTEELPDGVIAPYHVARNNDDARELRIRKIEEVAASLLSVDGWMHFRAAEPTLLVSPGALGIYTDFGPPKHGAAFYRPNLRTGGRLQLSMADLERATIRARDVSGIDFTPVVREIEVHIPEAFRFDAVAFKAMVTATDIVDVMAKSVGDLPASLASSWVGLRSLVSLGEAGEVDTDAIVHLATELAPWASTVSPRVEAEVAMLVDLTEAARTVRADRRVPAAC